ncbi:MAG: DUF4082 domain-containing protein [Planctomycetes bacterium]|nr:DUF4082 domain-containing protein [Planctomycetota bacterium]
MRICSLVIVICLAIAKLCVVPILIGGNWNLSNFAYSDSWSQTTFTEGSFSDTVTTTGAAEVVLSMSANATFTETFSTTTYKDPVTTADWNTASGILELTSSINRPFNTDTASSNYAGARSNGYRFYPTVNGQITALGRYHDTATTNTTVILWTDAGVELGRVTVPAATGWQWANLAAPVNVTANTYYRVAVSCDAGGKSKGFTYPVTKTNIAITNSCTVFALNSFPNTTGTTSLIGLADIEFKTYQSPKTGQSLKANAGASTINKATLIATQTLNGGAITYEMTANGSNWESVTPGVEHIFSNPGTDLRWRANISTAVFGTPLIDQIVIDYPGNYASPGTFISTAISPTGVSYWGILTYSKTTQVNTTITVDVLKASDNSLLVADVSSGTHLSETYPAIFNGVTGIKLRANLTTSEPDKTPQLEGWGTEYMCGIIVNTYNWTDLINGKTVQGGQSVAYVKFEMTTVSGTAKWKQVRIDKGIKAYSSNIACPDCKIEVQVWCENTGNGFWDVGDTLISKGNFTNGTCYLNMKCWQVTTTSKTYYIVYKLANDIGGGQRAGVKIGDSSWLEFENATCVGVP